VNVSGVLVGGVLVLVDAMLRMGKLIIKDLQAAYDQE